MTAVFTDFKDGVSFSGLSATPSAFTLLGGKYMLAANATWGGGSLTLSVLMPDGTTYVTAATALSADGVVVANLPPGTYELIIATATAVQGSLIRVPYRTA
jgi:hypothetical protein